MTAMQWSLYTFLPAMPPVHIPDSSGPLGLPETPLAASRRSVRSQQRRHLLVTAGPFRSQLTIIRSSPEGRLLIRLDTPHLTPSRSPEVLGSKDLCPGEGSVTHVELLQVAQPVQVVEAAP